MQRSIRWLIVMVSIAALILSACGGPPKSPDKVKPASVETVEGLDVKRVVLTEKAAERLDIQTIAVREEQVTRTRTVGGEVVAAPEGVAADPGVVWVQVRLNESDFDSIDRGQSALVRSLDDEDEEDGVEAEADEDAGTDDAEDSDNGEGVLYYKINSGQGLAAGQKVWVKLYLSGNGSSRMVIPYEAVIYDVNGGTWVYTNPEPLTFIRQSISIDYIEGDQAYLTEGPPVGTLVVTVGGAELFGTETGVSK